ncbi:hypothetical protein S40293_11078, partial [Stachybotrys chartarum IBT 40293]
TTQRHRTHLTIPTSSLRGYFSWRVAVRNNNAAWLRFPSNPTATTAPASQPSLPPRRSGRDRGVFGAGPMNPLDEELGSTLVRGTAAQPRVTLAPKHPSHAASAYRVCTSLSSKSALRHGEGGVWWQQATLGISAACVERFTCNPNNRTRGVAVDSSLLVVWCPAPSSPSPSTDSPSPAPISPGVLWTGNASYAPTSLARPDDTPKM